MNARKEEYAPLADAILIRLQADQPLFETENHLYNTAYVAAMQTKANEVRQQETGDTLLLQQKDTTKALYLLGDDLNKPIKLAALVFKKAALDTPICSELLKLIKKRNFEGALVKIKALQDVIAANATVLTTNGMKADLPIILQTAHAAITTKSNLQTDLIKQRKSFTNTNKGVYKELYAYITDVCKLGKIIFQGTPKAEEYTIEKILQKMHVTK